MSDLISRFFDDEDGAVSVDFVLLTAGAIGLALLIILTFETGLVNQLGRLFTVIRTGTAP